MFDFIRTHQRIVLAVLIILVLPSFVFLGVSGYTNMVTKDSDLAKVGNSTISEQEFDAVLRNQYENLQRNQSDEFDPALFDQPEVRKALLDRLIERQLLIELAQKEHFSASDNALREHIAAMPELQEDGAFSPERYEQMVRMVGMDTQGFEQSQRAELSLSRVLDPMLESAYLPKPVQELIINTMTDGREVQKSTRPLTDDLRQQTVNDQEIQQWYEEHRDAYAVPDYVNVEYVVLDEEAARAAVPTPSDSDLEDYYEQNKDRFSTTGRAHIAHILLALPQGADDEQRQEAYQEAQALAAQAQQEPERFADLAKEHSQDTGSASQGGDLGWLNQGTLPKELDEAIFTLGQGEISDVIEGADGYHIFKIVDIEPEQIESFADVRDKIVEEVTEQLAADQFADMATQLTEVIYEQADSLTPAADALGLKLQVATGLGREEALKAPIFADDDRALYKLQDASFLEDSQVRRAVFDRESLKTLENAGVIEIAPDFLVAVRATEYVPAHTPDLEDLEAVVKEELRHHKALEALKEQVEKDVAALRAGDELDIEFGETLMLSRTQPHDLNREALDQILATSTESLPTYTAIEEEDGYAIYKINKVENAQLSDLDKGFLTTQIKQLWQEAQQAALMAALAEQVGVEELPGMEQAIYTEEDF